MLYNYCPEMGEVEPLVNVEIAKGHLTLIKKQQIEMRANIGHYGNWYIDTKAELKGQGIRLISTGYESVNNGYVVENSYKVTDRAFDKLKAIYDIKRISYLD